MDILQKQVALIAYLEKFVTVERLKKINTHLESRTRHITIAVEDVFQSHNASAIVRSCEGFGIQDIHCIVKGNEFAIKKTIALGAASWLDVHYYRQEDNRLKSPTIECIEHLKQQGYRVIATSPHAITPLHKLPLDNKIALLFGTEDLGLSKEALALADDTITIPMYGFTESFNVSVSAALCLYDVTTRLRQSSIEWHLEEKEKQAIKLDWLRNSIDNIEIIERNFFLKNETI